jgi:hypothetical protein
MKKIKLTFKNSGTKLKIKDIKNFEKQNGIKFPDDFIEFLLSNNGCDADKNKYPFKFSHDKEINFFELTDFVNLEFMELFKNNEEYLDWKEEIYDEKFPKYFDNLICIATTEDGGHSEICMSLDESNKGEIFLVYDKTPDLTVLLANSFTDFINNFVYPFENEFEEACYFGDEKKAISSIENGLNLNFKDSYKNNLLHMAVYCDSDFSNVIKLLLSKGVKSEGALATAAANRKFDLVKILLENGANINELGGGNMTPLALASSNGYPEIVKYLLEHGANQELIDTSNRKAMDWVEFRNEQFPHNTKIYQEIKELLLKYKK